jgi:hypothetical protein
MVIKGTDAALTDRKLGKKPKGEDGKEPKTPKPKKSEYYTECK